jgi:hypothetical protein
VFRVAEVVNSDREPGNGPATKSGDGAAGAPAPVSAPRRRGGFGPAFVGGLVAATLGFATAKMEVLDQYLPVSPSVARTNQVLAQLRASDRQQSADLSTLRDTVSGIRIPDTTALQSQLDDLRADAGAAREAVKGLAQRIDRLTGRIAVLEGLDARLTALEKRPIEQGVSDQAIAAYERELAALQASMAAQRSEVEKALTEARTTKQQALALQGQAAQDARAARLRADLGRLRSAMDSGEGYADLLAPLRDGGLDLPGAITATADSGVATLAALNDSFPEAARDALSVARAGAGDGGGIGAYLKRQLGARSVTPRDGDDADAVLSRAEAALRSGDVQTALDEIATLPETARAKMAEWAQTARTRQAAMAALDSLASRLNSN